MWPFAGRSRGRTPQVYGGATRPAVSAKVAAARRGTAALRVFETSHANTASEPWALTLRRTVLIYRSFTADGAHFLR